MAHGRSFDISQCGPYDRRIAHGAREMVGSVPRSQLRTELPRLVGAALGVSAGHEPVMGGLYVRLGVWWPASTRGWRRARPGLGADAMRPTGPA